MKGSRSEIGRTSGFLANF